MKCPYCSFLEDKVLDSRESKDGLIIRRRRECKECGRRYTTYERIEMVMPLVVKKNNQREVFDRNKILAGIKKACEKRPVSADDIESAVTKIERMIFEKGEKEIKSSVIGEMVMKELYNLDQVAYVRFASVYREFKEITQFMEEVRMLLRNVKRR